MTTPFPHSTRRIRSILKSPSANILSPRVRVLAQVVWGIPVSRSAHANCLAGLPAYVSAEMEGNLSGWRGSPVHEHLSTCHRCAGIDADLLDIAILDAQGRFTPPDASMPNLSFLEPPNG